MSFLVDVSCEQLHTYKLDSFTHLMQRVVCKLYL